MRTKFDFLWLAVLRWIQLCSLVSGVKGLNINGKTSPGNAEIFYHARNGQNNFMLHWFPLCVNLVFVWFQINQIFKQEAFVNSVSTFTACPVAHQYLWSTITRNYIRTLQIILTMWRSNHRQLIVKGKRTTITTLSLTSGDSSEYLYYLNMRVWIWDFQ